MIVSWGPSPSLDRCSRSVDHVTPFDQIVDQFFGILGIDLNTTLLTAAVDAPSAPVWRNPQLTADFQKYHRGFPLRLVHRRENLSEIKRAALRG